MITNNLDTKSKNTSSRGARNQQVARAGEHYVAAELNKRGAYAVTFAGNMPKIDLLACDSDQSRTIHIQVKTKRSRGSWHSTIVGCGVMIEPADETKFWVFVDLGACNATPRYWVVPDWWMLNDIHRDHQEYLSRHGGKRAKNPDSKHHSIQEKRNQKKETTDRIFF